MKRTIITSLLSNIAFISAMSQSLTPVFKEIDAGQMLFRHKTAIILELKNTATESIRITNVDPGCGCVVSSYDSAEILPGKTSKVTLTFDGKQLGHFTRIVRVKTNTNEAPTEVCVTGEVVTKIVNYAGEYPCKLGELLADVDNIEFNDVGKGERVVREINIMNPTGQNVRPTALRLPAYLSVSTYPEILGPKQRGVMYVTLKSKELRDYGLTQTTIYLGKSPSDKVAEDKEIEITAVLLPPPLAENSPLRVNAPQISLSKQLLDMTAINKKKKVKDDIEITNNGKSTLEISKLQMFSPGLEVTLGKTTLAPGESTKLKVTAISQIIKKSKRRPRILMITNDPANQKIEVLIKLQN